LFIAGQQVVIQLLSSSSSSSFYIQLGIEPVLTILVMHTGRVGSS